VGIVQARDKNYSILESTPAGVREERLHQGGVFFWDSPGIVPLKGYFREGISWWQEMSLQSWLKGISGRSRLDIHAFLSMGKGLKPFNGRKIQGK
jgi:hypothetical protein